MLKVNDQIEVKIVDYTHEGLGIAKHEGLVIFIAYAKVNHTYPIKITKVSKNICYGEVINQKLSSDCKYYPQCGGCQIRHLNYQEQLTFKTNVVKNIINKQHINTIVNDCVACSNVNGYRNKVIMPLKNINGKITSGYYQNKSHYLIDIDDCLLVSDEVNQIINCCVSLLNEVGESAYDEDKKRGNVRNILIRQGFNTNQIMVCFVCFNNKLKQQQYITKTLVNKFSNITSVVINQHKRDNNATLGFKNFNLYNCNFICEQLGNKIFRIEPNTFFQVNTYQAEVLYDLINQALDPQPSDVILDAYCGVGSIGIYLASFVKEVIGIEINASSIKLANINAKLNNLNNTHFYAQDMKNSDKLINQYNINKIIVDPPRSGLDQNVINYLLKHEFSQIVYVSCNPATLARDLNLLSSKYDVKYTTPVDMFSNTYHVECVTKLVLK